MDDETRQALNRLRDRVDELNDNHEITVEALGRHIEESQEIRNDLRQVSQRVDLVLDEIRFFRRTLQQQINELRQTDDEEPS